ncbi:MAG: 16S rRNA (cytosine(1402)-N(4))-methyltransferase RsmH [Planctomycetota bacterium]
MGQPRLEHQPVLVLPLLKLLEPRPGETILDGTVGLGGHAAALIPRIMPGGRYIGIDWDDEMLSEARSRLSAQSMEGVELCCGNYAEFPEVLGARTPQRVDHLLLDLGVNSAQVSEPTRGFSFERDGPLDMRYDRQQKQKALDLINGLSENDMADLFFQYGQEGLSRKIARRICQVRHEGRITTTRTLAQAVESAVSAQGQRGGKLHPATRVFQALRICVNRELENLEAFLGLVRDYLAPGGKLAVISFHSLEDGIVKRFLRGAKAEFEELTRRPVIADPAERRANPRSRSAKLRVARRLVS